MTKIEELRVAYEAATPGELKGLPPLTPTNIVEGRADRIHKMPPGPNRWRERSRTYDGIGDAMALQWGFVAANSGNFYLDRKRV